MLTANEPLMKTPVKTEIPPKIKRALGKIPIDSQRALLTSYCQQQHAALAAAHAGHQPAQPASRHARPGTTAQLRAAARPHARPEPSSAGRRVLPRWIAASAAPAPAASAARAIAAGVAWQAWR